VAQISYPDFLNPIFAQFRASGRFFWSVAYIMLSCAVIALYKYNFKYYVLFLLFALFVQVADLKSSREILHQQINNLPKDSQVLNFDSPQLDLSQLKHIYFYPKYGCAKASSPYDTILPFMLYASTHNKTFSTGYIARYKPQCNTEKQEIADSNLSGSAYIFVDTEYGYDTLIKDFFANNVNIKCQKLDHFIICNSM
jgi:hypothetical protein